MSILPEAKLDILLAHHASLESQLLAQMSSENYVKITRELSELNPLIDAVKTYRAANAELAGIDALISDPATDAEMRGMAEAEREALAARSLELAQQIRVALLPKDAMDERNVVLEIRAGTGGDEAALFAGDLFRMYERWAGIHGFKVELLSASDGEAGGYREIVAAIRGAGVYARLKFESGVHRVQRVPATEGSGRIHTSAATVAVLPEAEDVDIEIKSDDLRIDTTRASSAGGQHANTTETAVRILHIPTGIIVTASEKSQHQNRARAMQVLRARLYDRERLRQDEERAAARKGQVGSGDRSERIRTYNFPQGRLTDHRINLTLYKLDKVLDGEALDEVIDALVADDQARRLSEFEGAEA